MQLGGDCEEFYNVELQQCWSSWPTVVPACSR